LAVAAMKKPCGRLNSCPGGFPESKGESRSGFSSICLLNFHWQDSCFKKKLKKGSDKNINYIFVADAFRDNDLHIVMQLLSLKK